MNNLTFKNVFNDTLNTFLFTATLALEFYWKTPKGSLTGIDLRPTVCQAGAYTIGLLRHLVNE